MPLIFIDFRPFAPSNIRPARLPVFAAEKSRSSSAVSAKAFWNAYPLRLVTFTVFTILVIPEHPLNAYEPTSTLPTPNVTFVIDVQASNR